MLKPEKSNVNQVATYRKPYQPDLMDFPFGHGGKRNGSGRKPLGKTVVIRIPAELLETVTEIKRMYRAGTFKGVFHA